MTLFSQENHKMGPIFDHVKTIGRTNSFIRFPKGLIVFIHWRI